MIKLFTWTWLDVGVWVDNPRALGTLRTWFPVRGKLGMLLSLRALWIGAHYSAYHKRLCVNLIPCVTFWVTLPGGQEP